MVAVRCLRPFRAGGDAFQPGAVVALDPLDAFAVLGVRAELVDPTDAAVIKTAVQEANRSALAQAGRRTDDVFGPWQRR